MLRNTADSQADMQRFIRRVADFDTVWYLKSEEGTACCESSAEPLDEHDPPVAVLLFFSDEAYAKRAGANFPGYRPQKMTLFDFLFRWLPGMSGDGVLAGPNWTAGLTGLEMDPFELREAIESAMTPEHVARHQDRYRELTQPRRGT